MNAIRLLLLSWAYVAFLSHLFAIPGYPQQSPVPSEVIFVPVVVHLVHDTAHSTQTKAELEALVIPQIKRLNADFSRRNANFYDQRYLPEALRDKMGAAMIQFYLAPLQANGSSSTLSKTGSSLPGVTYRVTRRKSFPPNDGPGFYRALKSARHGQKAWDPTRYLNIWVAEIEKYSGVAQYPWQYHLGSEWKEADGVVIDLAAFGVKEPARSARDGGRTLTHEIGHWLGLLHPFHEEGGQRDDFLADTPIPQQQNVAHYTWDEAPPALQPDNATAHKGKAFFMNFMDYAWDHCRNSFTHGQVQRMRATFEMPRIGIREFTPKEVQGSRSYFQFPQIRPVSGRPFLCQGQERVFRLDNVPTHLIRWEVGPDLKIVGPRDGVSAVRILPKSGRGTDIREIKAIVTAENGCGERTLTYQIEVFSPKILTPTDPSLAGKYEIDSGSRIHISAYQWRVSPELYLEGPVNQWSATAIAPFPSKTKNGFISLQIKTDCAGSLGMMSAIEGADPTELAGR